MELERAIRARHMVRNFIDEPIDPSEVARLLNLARRAPSAGHTAATEFVVLTGEHRSRYWNTTLPEDRRASFAFPGLLNAGALILVLVDPGRYVNRYAEADKSRTGLGTDIDAWPVPFWWVDSGAVIQNLLLLATEADLGACLFGVFDHEPAVRNELSIPDSKRIVAAVALGHPSTQEGRPGRSAGRPRPSAETIIHWQRWSPADQAPQRSPKPAKP